MEYRIYKTNRSGTGSAMGISLANLRKPEETWDSWTIFLRLARQSGENENGDSKFDWVGGIKIKMEALDAAEFLLVLQGTKEMAGQAGKGLYHESANGIRIIKFGVGEQGNITLSISGFAKDRTPIPNIFIGISDAEATILANLLRYSIPYLSGWSHSN